jgi:hypothetical protein
MVRLPGKPADRQQLQIIINSRLNKLLTIAEAALPTSQFQAFRKLTLDEFGKSGLANDLDQYFKQHHGMARHGQE